MKWITDIINTYKKGLQYDEIVKDMNVLLKQQDQFKQAIDDLETENIFNNKTRINKTNGDLSLNAYQSVFWIGRSL